MTLARACWGTGSSTSGWSVDREQFCGLPTPGEQSTPCCPLPPTHWEPSELRDILSPETPTQSHQHEAASCGTTAAAEADGDSVTAVSPHGELQGWGESHLFDIEQQQQLQHLHSWQERSEENAQPGSRGKTSLSGSEPHRRQWCAQLQHPQGSWGLQVICQQRKEPQKAETSHQVRVCP